MSLLRATRAGVLGQMGCFDEAISEGKACFTLRTGPSDKSTPYTIMLAAKHGSTLLLAGQPAQAAEHLRNALALSEQAFGHDHAQTVTVRRLLAEAEGVSAKDPHQLEVLAELLAHQPDTHTREAISIRKSRVAVLAAQGQVRQAVDEARQLLSVVDPAGTNSRESAVVGLDLARGLRIAAPQVAKELASKAAMAFERDLGVESNAATLANKFSVGIN